MNLLLQKLLYQRLTPNPNRSYILENDEKLNHLELMMLSSNFIVAGSGTSAGGMSGLTYLLLRNPDKLAKLKQEI